MKLKLFLGCPGGCCMGPHRREGLVIQPWMATGYLFLRGEVEKWHHSRGGLAPCRLCMDTGLEGQQAPPGRDQEVMGAQACWAAHMVCSRAQCWGSGAFT